MRKDDSANRTYCRANDRIFQRDGTWWFSTRDEDCGPHPSKEEAESRLAEYVKQLRGEIDLDELNEFSADQESVSDARSS